jgi:hypothetical protein
LSGAGAFIQHRPHGCLQIFHTRHVEPVPSLAGAAGDDLRDAGERGAVVAVLPQDR